MHPYNEVYVIDVARSQGEMFLYVDEKWFITAFMKSNIRALLDDGNPKYLNMPAPKMLDKFINIENKGFYKRGEEWWGLWSVFILLCIKWAGMQLS